MGTKTTCVGLVSLTVLLLAGVAAAQDEEIPYSGTPGGGNRWVYVHEPLGPMPPPTPAGDLFAGTWNAVGGAFDAVGKTFGAVYASLFPAGGAAHAAPLAAGEAKRTGGRRELKYRYWPRFQGRVARWTVSVEED